MNEISSAQPPSARAIEDWLVANIAALAQRPAAEVDPQIPVTAFGLESLALFSLAGDLASWLGHEVSTTLLWEYPTIEAIAAHLGQGEPEPTAEPRYLVPIQPSGELPTLYLVHEVSGTLWCYSALARYMGTERPLYGFQISEIEDALMPLCIEDLAAVYVGELRAHQPQGPYFLGGFSLGGTIAFEMAQQLRKCGEEVALLVLMDTFFPGLARRRPSLSRRIRTHARHLRELEAPHQRDYLRQRIGRLLRRLRKKPAPKVLTEAQVQQQLLKSQMSGPLNRALNAYQPRPYQGCVTLLRARMQFSVAPDHRFWRRVACGGLQQYFLSGSHGSIVSEPDVFHLAALLQRCLRHAQRP